MDPAAFVASARKSTLYELLGASSTDENEALRKAYRRRSLQFHPDKHAGDDSATEAFLIISRAYEILSDDEARLAYDVKLAREARASRAATDRAAARADAKRRDARRAAADAARTKADAARNAEFVRKASSRYASAAVARAEARFPAAAKPFETRAARAAARQQQRFASKLAPDDDSDDASSAADHAEWSDIAGGLAAGSPGDRRAAAARMAAELERYRAKFDSELADMMDAELRRLDEGAPSLQRGEQPRSAADVWAALSAPEAPETPAPRTAAVDVDAVTRGQLFRLRARGGPARAHHVAVARGALAWREPGGKVAGSVPLGDVVAVDVKTRKLATVLLVHGREGRWAFEFLGSEASPATWAATLTYLAAGGWMTRAPARVS